MALEAAQQTARNRTALAQVEELWRDPEVQAELDEANRAVYVLSEKVRARWA